MASWVTPRSPRRCSSFYVPSLAALQLALEIRSGGIQIASLTYQRADRYDSTPPTAFDPNGTIIATADDNHRVRLSTVSTGGALTHLDGHTGQITDAAFSPDGTTLATSSTDDTIRLWNVATGVSIVTLSGHTADVTDVVCAGMA